MEIKKYKLTDICDFQGGSQPPKKEWSKSKKEGYVRMLQIRDFTQSHKDNVEYVKVSKRLKTCKSDDILIGRYGASVGKILTGLEGAFNVAIMKTIPNEKILSKKYLLAILKAPVFQNFILNVGVRAAQAGFNKDDLSKFHLYIPSLDNQNRIAKVLFDCERLIRKRKESIELLDEFLKSIFLEMFGDPAYNPNNFETVKIRDLLIEAKYGTSSPANDGQYPYLRMNNIDYNGYWDYSSLKHIDIDQAELHKYSLQKGDVVFNRTNSKELVGKTGIYEDDKTVVIAGYLIRLRTQQKTNPYFLWGHLNSKYTKQRLFNMCRNIVGMANINAQEVQNIKILNPPKNLQDKYEKIVKNTLSLKENSKNSLLEIENLYGSISQKAFKGELDLNKVDISQFDELNIPETNFEELLNEDSAKSVTIEKLEQIIKSRFGYQEFSILQIEEILSKQGIDYNTSLVKGFIKDLLSEEKIRTEYSGSTHQVIFKYNQ